MKLFRDFLIIVVVFAGLWYGFSLIQFEGIETSMEISIDRENDLSELLIEQIEKQFEPVKNKELDSMLTLITSRLEENISKPQFDHKFTVIKNSQINAFATLGGNIYINTGLIEFLKDPEELAAVIAHELGHVEERHVINKITKELGISLAFSILTGSDPALVSELVRKVVSTGFDRKQEEKADDFGINLLIKSNIHPGALARFFMRISDKSDIPDGLEVIMTHPNNKKRMERAVNSSLPDDFEEQKIDIDWEYFQTLAKS